MNLLSSNVHLVYGHKPSDIIMDSLWLFLHYIFAIFLILQRQTRQVLHELHVNHEPRQADGDLLSTLISLGLKYGPTLFNAVFGGGASGQQQTTDRIEELEIKVNLYYSQRELKPCRPNVCISCAKN